MKVLRHREWIAVRRDRGLRYAMSVVLGGVAFPILLIVGVFLLDMLVVAVPIVLLGVVVLAVLLRSARL